jgi:hypothetical protein
MYFLFRIGADLGGFGRIWADLKKIRQNPPKSAKIRNPKTRLMTRKICKKCVICV